MGYLSGVEDCELPEGDTVADAAALLPFVESIGKDGSFAGVDILLSSQWPLFVHGAAGLGGTAPPRAMPTRPSGTVTLDNAIAAAAAAAAAAVLITVR